MESICDSGTLGTVQLGAGLQADAPNVPPPSPEELAVHWLGGVLETSKTRYGFNGPARTGCEHLDSADGKNLSHHYCTSLCNEDSR